MPGPVLIKTAPSGLTNNFGSQSQVRCWPQCLAKWNVVGNWDSTIDPTYMFNGYFSNGNGGPAANHDSMEFRFVMTAGLYTFRVWAPRMSDCGSVDVAMNDVALFTSDMYNAALAPFAVLSQPQVAVANGLQRLSFTVNGKNGASAGFFFRMSFFEFVPYLEGVL